MCDKINFNFRPNSDQIISEKLDKMNDIKDDMLNGSHRKRPNCQQIIDSMTDWTLNENEIKELKIFAELETKFLNENESSRNFFLSFLDSKMNSTKH